MVGGQSPSSDTIHLKNGSIIHGRVVRYENDTFTIVIPGTQSRAMINVNDVASIEFAGASAGASTVQTTSKPPVGKPSGSQPEPPAKATTGSQPTSSPESPAPSPVNQLIALGPNGGAGESKAKTEPGKEATANRPVARDLTVPIPANQEWTDSGIDIKKGEVIRFSASGKVKLSRTQTSGPEGLNLADPGKLMPNRPTGGLIAVIGDDNDDFYFVGPTAEVVAPRGGRLFLMVNEEKLTDNSGAFNVRIQVHGAPAAPKSNKR
jgi:hypothetical protein